jgi:hypothetical protein
MKKLYEIWWKHLNNVVEVQIKDYLWWFGDLSRRQVISTDRALLEKTIEQLKFRSPCDDFFEIREV